MAEDNQSTKLIHITYDGNFQLETNAKVLSYRILSDEPSETKSVRVELQLDQTTMHPQGGGQPTDIGTIRPHLEPNYSAQIDKVTIDRGTGVVTHAGSMTLPPDAPETIETTLFSPSTPVTVSVDASNRRILSECHTAGHVVDAAMARCEALLPPTKGYHFMDGPYVEYRGTLENKEEFLERLKGVYLVRSFVRDWFLSCGLKSYLSLINFCNYATDQHNIKDLINEDIPTTIQTLSSDKAETICNRLAQNFNMADFCTQENPNVRVVSVAGYSCPCGGTHVRSTGELKERGWCVKGLRCKKGVVRVRYGTQED